MMHSNHNPSNDQPGRIALPVIRVLTLAQARREDYRERRQSWWILMHQMAANQKCLTKVKAVLADDHTPWGEVTQQRCRVLQEQVTTLKREYCALYRFHPEEYDATEFDYEALTRGGVPCPNK